MSIATELSRLQQAKADLETSIEAKGVNVPAGTKLDAYPALVDTISSTLTGDAAVGEVLANKTFYSNDPASKLTGTMPNNGEVDTDITAVAQSVTIAQGYHNGSGTVQIAAADQAKLIAGNIKSGVTVLGVNGDSNVVDTSSGDAVEADLQLGKIAYVQGEEVVGSSTKNADTTDATLTANDMLYGVTGYGADGTKLTGAGAYWPHVKSMFEAFNGGTLTGDVDIYAPTCSVLFNAFRGTAITSLKFVFGTISGNFNYPFYGCTSLVTLDGVFTLATTLTSLPFYNCSALVTVAFTPSCITSSISFSHSPLLSTASLLSIANGLDAASPATLTMHATSKTNMDNINVDVVDGLAVIGTTKTLTQFITTDKGWTIA